MSIAEQNPIIERAIEWHVRLRDGGDDVWEAFAAWLEEDPRHADAYERIEALDDRIGPLLDDIDRRQPANDLYDEPQPRRRFLYWAGGALAASVAAALLLIPQLSSQSYEVATTAGERRQLELEQGTDIALNGDTKLVLDRENTRSAELVQGQALFRVRHDDNRPFVVAVGDVRIVDVGTIFEVVRDGGEIRVAVSEGKVEYRAAGKTVPLDAGQSLIAASDGKITVSDTPIEAVGSWQHKRYLYAGAPLSRVASDLSRSLGVGIRVDSALGNRPFSGNLHIEGASEAELHRLAAALDVRLQREGRIWVMRPPTSAPD